MDNQARARALVDELQLQRMPVAMAFVDEAPAGVRTIGTVEPSACTYWRQAEHDLFYAAAAQAGQASTG